MNEEAGRHSAAGTNQIRRNPVTKKQDIHVVPHHDGWATRKEGSELAGGVYPTENDALEQAKREKVEGRDPPEGRHDPGK
jgi:hypothetical protein